MKLISAGALLAVLLASCQTQAPLSEVISQKYVHKYGFDVSEAEWSERAEEGQVVAELKNGVTITRSYEGGLLHGATTYTFPQSDIIEKQELYDQGTLLKETIYDLSGMPIREDVYEFDNRNLITLWDEKGVPLSIEEYENNRLMEGKYYTPDHELEAKVEQGAGERVKRDRTGLLISRDAVESGAIRKRTTYHPNGDIHAISHYKDYQLDGEQFKYTSTGKPLMRLHWDKGVLDGMKIVYRNGLKIAEVPYVNGEKHGIEHHYDDLGNLTADIEWRRDKKHGPSKYYTDETTDMEWFFKGQPVTADKYEVLESRDQIIAELSPDR